MEQEAFNASYYSTLAQVIPVVFFAAVVSRWWNGFEDARVERNILFIGVVLIAVAGETVALRALSDRQEPTEWEDSTIFVALFLSALVVVISFAGPATNSILLRTPERMRPVVERWVEPIGAALVLAFVFLRPDPLVILIVAAFTCFAAVIAIGQSRAILEWWRARRGSDAD